MPERPKNHQDMVCVNTISCDDLRKQKQLIKEHSILKQLNSM